MFSEAVENLPDLPEEKESAPDAFGRPWSVRLFKS